MQIQTNCNEEINHRSNTFSSTSDSLPNTFDKLAVVHYLLVLSNVL